MQKLTKAVFDDRNLNLLPEYLEGGSLPALTVGLGAVGRANIAAGLRLCSGRPLIVVCSDDTEAESLQRDLCAFLEEPVAVLSGRDMNFYFRLRVFPGSGAKTIDPSLGCKGAEIKAAVCSLPGLLQRTAPKAFLDKAALYIEDGKSCAPERVERRSSPLAIQRTLQVEGPASFPRGGILDFYSPAYDSPVRCEFWADSWRDGLFDVDTQRRSERLESLLYSPSREFS